MVVIALDLVFAAAVVVFLAQDHVDSATTVAVVVVWAPISMGEDSVAHAEAKFFLADGTHKRRAAMTVATL